jgi:hypothetical protein
MPGQGGIPWINDRSTAEHYLSEHHPELAAFRQRLYERETAVHYGVGTALLYHENTWSGAPHARFAALECLRRLAVRVQAPWHASEGRREPARAEHRVQAGGRGVDHAVEPRLVQERLRPCAVVAALETKRDAALRSWVPGAGAPVLDSGA